MSASNLNNSLAVVTLKGFGDFIIALIAINSLKGLGDLALPQFKLVAGRHVMNLADSLGVKDEVIFVGDDELKDVPAIYDLKNKGYLSGLKSLIKLHSDIADILGSSSLIFDKVGVRERLLSIGHKLHSLPESGNIYLSYNLLFKEMGYEVIKKKIIEKKSKSRAIIVPSARASSRVLPAKVIQQVYKKLINYDYEVKVILLDGESCNVSQDINMEIIPRKFSSLIGAIKSADLVISADSLPAHLSEFFNIPIFVLTPDPTWTNYWLPKSAYISNGMSSFENLDQLNNWLDL